MSKVSKVSGLGKAFVAAFIAVVAACGACAPAVPSVKQPERVLTLEEQIDASRAATVALYRADDVADLVCAGTRVSPTQIVTAYHCVLAAGLPEEVLDLVRVIDPTMRNTEVEGIEALKIPFRTFKELGMNGKASYIGYSNARIAKLDRMHDLALLTTERSDQPYAAVSEGDLRTGDAIYAVGHPNGLLFAATQGHVSAPCRHDSEEESECWTELDLTIYGGSSGGGLFNARGELVGACSSGFRGFAVGYYSTPEAIRELLHGT